MPQFEIGDEVTIVAGSEYDGDDPEHNPSHGQAGVVQSVGGGGFESHIGVIWSHSHRRNIYRPEDLEMVTRTKKPKKKTRVSFRTWIAELNGEEVKEVDHAKLYPLPGTLTYSCFKAFLQEYANTGEISHERLMNAFTWTSCNVFEEGEWSELHEYPSMLNDRYREVLDSWCEQEGIAPMSVAAPEPTTITASTLASLPW